MDRKKYLSIKLVIMVVILLIVSVMAFNFSGLGTTQTPETNKQQSFSNVDKIIVESLSLNVKIVEGPVDKVRVTDSSKFVGFKNREPNIIVQEGKTLKIKQRKGGFFLSFVTGNIVIEVPPLTPMTTNIIYDISNVSGDIDFDAFSKDQLNLKTVSGSIKVYEKNGEKIDAKTTSGSIEIRSPFGKIKTKSVSGNIKLFGGLGSKEIESSTVSGSIKIQTRKDHVTGIDFNYKSTTGNVENTYTNTEYGKSGNITEGDSSLKIEAKSVSGSIKLTDWK